VTEFTLPISISTLRSLDPRRGYGRGRGYYLRRRDSGRCAVRWRDGQPDAITVAGLPIAEAFFRALDPEVEIEIGGERRARARART
jgi:hypothetical protein